MEEIIGDYLPEVIVAMGIVLAIVVIVMIYLIIQNNAIKTAKQSEDENAIDSAAISLEKSEGKEGKRSKSAENEEEIVAAIIAAICSYSGMTAEQFEIKSIKMINSGSSNWRRQSLIS